MYICNECGNTFETPRRDYTGVDVDGHFSQKEDVCPFCGECMYEDAHICDVCGEYAPESEFLPEIDMCYKCFDEAVRAIKKSLEAHGTAAELAAFKIMMEEVEWRNVAV